jgi:sugar lactone lactonase YvrE
MDHLRTYRWLSLSALLLGAAACSTTPPPPPQAEYGEPAVVEGPLPYLGVHGLGIDPRGRLLAGSVVGQSLSLVDRESGAVRPFVGPPAGMADDVAFGPDGEVAWTAYLVGELRIRNAAGEIRTVASGLPGLNSLAYTEDGRLFATQVFMGDALYEIDRGGEQPPRKIIEGMGGLNGFEFGPDGHLYGPLWFKGEVVRVNVESGEMDTVADGFRIPAAVNFDGQGRLYVVDSATGELLRLRPDSGEKVRVARLKPSLDNLAIDKQAGLLYVSNMADNSIQEVDLADGRVRDLVRTRLAAPSGLAMVGDQLHIADTFAYRVMDTGSGDIREVGRMWASHLEYPLNAWADEHVVVLTSWATGTVQVFDRASGEMTHGFHDFQAPHDAVQLADGSLLVAELATGRLLRVSGEQGEQREAVVVALAGPAGMAFNADRSTLFVTTAGGSVWAVNPADWSRRRVRDGLAMPEGISVSAAGKLLVMEVGKQRLLEIDPVDGATRTLAEDLPVGLPALEGLPPTGVFNDVVEAANGDLFFTADRDAGLYRLPRR